MGNLIFLIFFFSLSAFGNISEPEGAIFLNNKAYSISLSEYVFSTTSYLDVQGHENSVPVDTGYLLSDTDLKINYGIAKNIELNFMGRIRRVSSTAVINGTAQNLSKLGLESGSIGVKFQFEPINNIHYAIGGHYRQTLYTNAKYTSPVSAPTDTIILGDDGHEYGVNIYTTFLYSKNRFDVNFGYLVPPNSLSQEITYKGEYKHQFESFGVILGAAGIYSLKNDPYTLDPSSKPQMSNGSTSLFNSINTEKLEGYFGALYDFKKVTLEAKGGMVFNGVSTDKGYFALFNLTWSSAGITDESIKIESFKEYNIDGSVLKVSARGNLVKIDQGLSTDVEKGMTFDIYQTDYFGGNVLVATGHVLEIGADWSIIKLVKKFKEIEIKPGFAARGK